MTLELRGYALGLWPEDGPVTIDPARKSPGIRGKLAGMKAAGWLDEVPGGLALNDAGRTAIRDLLPVAVPTLTESQAGLLSEALDRGSVTGDPSYAPVVRLLAYGLLHARQQRFGGLVLRPTDLAREWASRQAPVDEATSGPTP